MKRTKKIFLRLLPVVLVLIVITFNSGVFGADPINPNRGLNTSISNEGTANTKITGLANNIWATLAVIIQIAAIGAVIFAGVRYMFASADSKADIKKELIPLVAGAVLVFAAVPVVKFIANVANDLLK